MSKQAPTVTLQDQITTIRLLITNAREEALHANEDELCKKLDCLLIEAHTIEAIATSSL